MSAPLTVVKTGSLGPTCWRGQTEEREGGQNTDKMKSQPLVAARNLLKSWLRGVNLNHRPLGYEGKQVDKPYQSERISQENLPCAELAVGCFWRVLAGFHGQNANSRAPPAPACSQAFRPHPYHDGRDATAPKPLIARKNIPPGKSAVCLRLAG